MKKIGLLIFFFIVFYQLLSQNLQQRIKVEKSFYVVKNENSILPFIRLDTLKISIYSIGKPAKIFYNSALRYAEVDTTGLLTSNAIVYLIFDKNFDTQQISDSLDKKIGVLIYFGRKIKTSSLQNKANAIITTTLSDSLTQDYAAQLIFGAFSADGNDFIKGGIRFKYTIPQEVGLDSAYIYNKVDSIAKAGIELGAYPGCQIFAAVDKKVIFYKSYGFHTYNRIKPVKNFNLYDLASITKIAASVPCLMLLYQNGDFSLFDKISKYYKPFRHSNKKNITFIDALTHQARLQPWIPFWKVLLLDKNGNFKKDAFSTHPTKKFSVKVADNLYLNKKYKRKVFKVIKKSELLRNKSYKYSDLSFYIYPLIVEKLYGQSFEQCLETNFYKPLGAWSMMFNPLRKFDCRDIIPTEYDREFRRQLLCGYVDDEGAAMLGGISGHAGLFANANDLAKLMQMYCDYGVYGGIRYFDSSIVKQWTSYQFAAWGNRRAIGFDKPLLKNKHLGTPSPLASDKSFGHSGFTGTFAWADPQYHFVFVFLSNRIYPSRSRVNLLKYNIRPSIHTVFYRAILKQKFKDFVND